MSPLKRMIRRSFIVALALWMLSLHRLSADFSGAYDQPQWTFNAYGGEGAADFFGELLLLDSGYSGSGNLAQADLTVRAPKAGTFHFAWAFYGGTTTGYKLAWLRNGNATTIVSRRDYAEGSDSFNVSAGDVVGFRITAPIDEFPSMAEVYNFFAPGQEPGILVPPGAQSVCHGNLAFFSVIATNALEYQWQFKGQNLPDEMFEDLIFRAVPPTDSGNYRVIVRNPLGSVTSASVPLTIKYPPAITTQPATDITRCAGDSVTLSVAASGTNPHFQWRRNGTDLPGAVTPTVTLSNLTTADSGQYTARASNECGWATSSPLVLTVFAPPVIAAQPQSQTRYPGESVTFYSTLATSTSAQYQWRCHGTNLPGANGQFLIVSNLQPAHAGNYSVTVSNPCGVATSTEAMLTIAGEPVAIRIVAGRSREVSIEVLGAVGRQYVLEISSDLTTWTPIGTNWLVISGSPLFSDAATGSARFYRVRPVN